MNKPVKPPRASVAASSALGLVPDPLAGQLIALEPRMVFDGAGAAIAVEAAAAAEVKQPAIQADAAETKPADRASPNASHADDLDWSTPAVAVAASPMAAPSAPREVVFIDSRVKDIDSFREKAGSDRLIVVVGPDEEGIAAVTRALAGLHDIDAIHIVAHGGEGGFSLGQDWIDADMVDSHASDIRAWSAALTADADILLYGCDVATGSKGESLIKSLADKTGADVAASADDVGLTERGPDWSLEKASGTIETSVIAPDHYDAKLDTSTDVSAAYAADDVAPKVANILLTRGQTYVATDNWTNDTKPRFTGGDAGPSAIVRAWYTDSDNRVWLVGSAAATTTGAFSVQVGVFASVDRTRLNLLAELPARERVKITIRQEETGKTESPGVDNNSTFFLNIRSVTEAPTPLTQTQVRWTNASGVEASNPLVTTNSTQLVAITLSAAQRAQVQKSGFVIEAWYRNSSGQLTRAAIPNGSTVIYPPADSGAPYTVTMFPIHHNVPELGALDVNFTFFFYVKDGTGNYIDGNGSAATNDVPQFESAARAVVRFMRAEAPVITGFVDDVGADGSPSTPVALTAGSTTDDMRPRITGTMQNPELVKYFTVSARCTPVGGGAAISRTVTVQPTFDGNNWSIDLDLRDRAGNAPSGAYTVTIVSVDINDIPAAGATLQFNLDTIVPTFRFRDAVGPVQNESIASGALVDGVTLTGDALKAGGTTLTIAATITDKVDVAGTPRVIGTRSLSLTTTVNQDGTWSYALPSAVLGNGLKDIAVTVTDANGRSVTRAAENIFVTGAWTPGGLGLNGLDLWYDASIGSAVVADRTTGAVSLLKDLSGRGLDASQATAAFMPMLVTPVANGTALPSYLSFASRLRADGTLDSTTADYLSLPVNVRPISLYYIGQIAAADNSVTKFQDAFTMAPLNGNFTGTGAGYGFYAAGGTTARGYGVVTDAWFPANPSSYTRIQGGSDDTRAQPWVLGSVWKDGTTISSAINNQFLASTTSSRPLFAWYTNEPNTGGFGSIGGRFNGQIGSIIGYSRVLSAAENEILANAQAQRFGVGLASGAADRYVVNTRAGTSEVAAQTAQIAYSNDVGGILHNGTTAVTRTQNGGLVITDTSFLSAGASILFGNNGRSGAFTQEGPDTATPGLGHFLREWAIDVTLPAGQTGGTVDVAFDVASLASASGQSWEQLRQVFDGRANLKLAWRATEADSWTYIATADADLSANSGKIVFKDVKIGAQGLRDGFLTMIDGPIVMDISNPDAASSVLNPVIERTTTFRVQFSEPTANFTTQSFKVLTRAAAGLPAFSGARVLSVNGATGTDARAATYELDGNHYVDVVVEAGVGEGQLWIAYDYSRLTGVDVGTTNAGNAVVDTRFDFTTATVQVDTKPPVPTFSLSDSVLTLVGDAGTTVETSTVTITFDDPTFGFGLDDVSIVDLAGSPVTGFTISDFTGADGDRVFTFRLSAAAGLDRSQYKVRLASGSQSYWDNRTNSSGEPVNFASQTYDAPFAVDTVRPSATLMGPNTTISLTNADTLTFRVAFSRPVTGVDATDFAVFGVPEGTSSQSQFSAVDLTVVRDSVDTSGATWLVTVRDRGTSRAIADFNGTVGLRFADAARIQGAPDATFPGNAFDPVLPGADAYRTYTLDNAAPDRPALASFLDDVGLLRPQAAASGTVTDDRRPFLRGTAEPNSSVAIQRFASATATTGTLLGNASTDADGVWTFELPFDLTEGQSFFRVNATDAAGNVSLASNLFTIVVDTTAPVIGNASLSVRENSVAATAGTVQATDASAVTYELTSGTSLFTIDAVSGTVRARADAVFDYEAATQHAIGVKATDAAGNASERTFIVSVTDVSEAPVITSATNASVAENTAAGDVVYTIEAIDVDNGKYGPLRYSLAGPDAGDFKIDAAGQVLFRQSPNFESGKTSYSIRVVVTNGGTPPLSDARDVTIAVLDLNEAPLITSAASVSVAESTAAGAVVYTIAARDPDAGANGTLTYSLEGEDAQAFAVNANGQVSFRNAPDFESGKTSYSIRVVATDGGTPSLTAFKDVAIAVLDVNEAPVITSAATASVAENVTAGTVVYTIEATDQDAGANGSFTYSLEGADAQAFTVNGNGEVSINGSPDFESGKTSYSVRVVVRDGGSPQLTASKDVTIGVLDLNEAPVITSATSVSVAENTAAGAVVYTIAANDPDAGANGTLTYSLQGADAQAFAVNASGQVSFRNAPDFESGKTSYSIRVVATDGGTPSLTAVKDVTIAVLDVNEAPVITSAATASVAENVPAGTVVYTIEAADQDAGANGRLSYALEGADAGLFTVNANGQVSINGSPDFESGKTSYSLRVVVKDGGSPQLTASKDVTIGVLDLNEAPVITSATSVSVAENTVAGAVVYTIAATDSDAGANGRLTYSLEGADAQAFAVNANGQVSFRNAPDFESGKTSYSIRVVAMDAGTPSLTAFKDVTIAVLDVNEAPLITSAATASVAEIVPAGTVVYTIEATDPDAGVSGGLSYALEGGDAALFTVNSNGQVSIKASPDFESGKTSYSVRVVVRDGGSPQLTASKDVTIDVLDLNEAPVITSATSVSVAENTVAGAVVYTIAATDSDAGANGTLTYSLEGADAQAFAVNASGQVSFRNAPDFESGKTSYSIRVVATDGGTPSLTAVKDVTIDVLDVNEAPVITSAATASVAENVPAGTVVYTIEAADQDAAANGSLTYTLEGADAGLFTVNGSGEVSINGSPNFESGKTSYSVRVVVRDGGSPQLTASKDVTIAVLDVNEAPVGLALAGGVVFANDRGAVVGQLSATDPDGTPQTFSFTVSDARFEVVGSVLKLKSDVFLPESVGTSLPIAVTVTDQGGLFHTQTVRIEIRPAAFTPQGTPVSANMPTQQPLVSAPATQPFIVSRVIDSVVSTTFGDPFASLLGSKPIQSFTVGFDGQPVGSGTTGAAGDEASAERLEVTSYLRSFFVEVQLQMQQPGGAYAPLDETNPAVTSVRISPLGDGLRGDDEPTFENGRVLVARSGAELTRFKVEVVLRNGELSQLVIEVNTRTGEINVSSQRAADAAPRTFSQLLGQELWGGVFSARGLEIIN